MVVVLAVGGGGRHCGAALGCLGVLSNHEAHVLSKHGGDRADSDAFEFRDSVRTCGKFADCACCTVNVSHWGRCRHRIRRDDALGGGARHVTLAAGRTERRVLLMWANNVADKREFRTT